MSSVVIDVHHHFNPTFKDNEGNPWSVAMALEELDRNNVTTAIASLGPLKQDNSADHHQKVRRWNEWAKTICLDHKGKFGLFALLPMLNIDIALRELEHAYDVLNVDGIALSTNEGDIWLSDERNETVFAELNRRKAVVFVHPAPTTNCSNISKAYGGNAISSPWLEFPVNTARVILGLLAKGVTRRHPDIRFIFSHGGGVMPLLLGRIAGFNGWRTVGETGLSRLFPDGIHAEFARLYFDCAQAYAPEAIDLMRKIVPESHLLFGTDFSYFPVSHSIDQLHRLDLNEQLHSAISGENAAKLFPQFASISPL